MTVPYGLSEPEAAAWAHLAKSVTPMEGRTRPVMPKAKAAAIPPRNSVQSPPKKSTVPPPPKRPRSRPLSNQSAGLDSHWDRKLKGGQLTPDFTLDLHGHSLDSAYSRLMSGLDQAMAMNARVVLVIAGRSRPVDPADRGQKRGAIRAKLLDWLAAGPHADAITAVRKAHRKHGGEGALYLVLRR
ncbi:MAG: Smr/MutS family protein [Erythrobacter sp.]